jgi:hypothetical protein
MRQISWTFLTHDLHLKQTLLLCLDTFKKRGVGKLEFVIFGSFESVVGLGLRDLLNELFEVTTGVNCSV